MKKIFSNFLTIASLSVMSIGYVACSDTDGPKFSGDLIEVSSDELTGGNSVIIFDLNKDYSDFNFHFAALDDLEIEIQDESECPVILKLHQIEDKVQQLRCEGIKDEFKDFMGTKVFNLIVKSRAEGKQKNVKMVVRKASSSPYSEYDEYAAGSIGYSIQPWTALGSPSAAILDFDVVKEHLESYALRRNFVYETGGERYEKTVETIGGSFGFGGKGPKIKNFKLEGDAGFDLSHTTTNEEYFEYYYGIIMKRVVDLWLNEDWVKSLRDEAEDAESFAYYLNEDTNKVLNGERGNSYFNNGQEGIFDLLDAYGTYVSTQGGYGGNYFFVYRREENAYEYSIGAEASMNVKFTEGAEKAKTWLEEYQNKTHSNYVKTDASINYYNDNYQKASRSKAYRFSTGGNMATDVTSWDESFETNSNWVRTSYIKNGYDGDGHLIPIYEFIYDDARRQLVIDNFDAYLEKNEIKFVDQPVILADVRMIAVEESDHIKDQPEPKVLQAKDDNTYIYFPMRALDAIPGVITEQKMYAFETNQNCYVDGTTHQCHYWYYALSHNGFAPGLQYIRFHQYDFGNAENNYDQFYGQKWEYAGDHANQGVTGLIDNNYVEYIYADLNDPADNKIKAVAIVRDDDDYNYKTDACERVLATSGGAELKAPFTSNSNRADFNNYWAKLGPMSECADFYTGGLSTPNSFKIISTTKPWMKEGENLSFGKDENGDPIETPKIDHANKWLTTHKTY